MNQWAWRTVNDVAERVAVGPFGSSIKVDTFVPSGVPVISGQHLRESRLNDSSGYNFVSREHAARLSRALVRRGDVILTHAGTIGQVALIPRDSAYEEYIISQRQFYIRCNRTAMEPTFLTYYLRSQRGQHDLLANASYSGVPSIAQPSSYVKTLSIPVPPLAEQQAIADVLGALDDKIIANTTLSDLALAYADSSFPPGGTPARLGEMVSITKGNSYRSVDLVPSETALVTLKSIGRDGRYVEGGLKEYAGAYRADQVLRADEIVVAQTDLTQAADVVGRAVRVPSSSYRTLIASLDLAIVRPVTDIEPMYLLGLLRQSAFREHCRSNTTGTTVLHLRSGAMEEFTAGVAAEGVQQKYAALAAPLIAQSDALATENRTLAATRDALLPQLMSGKLRVRDAERIAEEAGV